MSRLWVDPPEGWKHGFPAIYDPETDGQMSEWIVNKGYPVQTIKEYGEQWHIRCWPAEEPEKYPDQVINAQKHSEVIKNTPIGTKMRKTTREEKISKPAVYEVPEETHRKVTVSEVLEELNFAKLRIQELRDRIDVLEKENVNHSGQNKPNLFKTTAMTGNTQDEMIAKLTKMLDIQQKLHETAIDMLKPAIDAAYQKGYADAMGWKTQNHLEHLPPKEKNNG